MGREESVNPDGIGAVGGYLAKSDNDSMTENGRLTAKAFSHSLDHLVPR